MPTWIDFKELRSKLNFEDVLRHYKVEVKCKGTQHHGLCPLPDHSGNKSSPSFSANLEKGIFQCFGCGGKGNVLEFAAMMEKVDLEDGAALRKVAIELQKRFCPELESTRKPKTTEKAPEKVETLKELSTAVNVPLDFELKELDAEHPYLKDRGFTQATIDHFGLGFCSRGMLKNRIAVPLHDHAGSLVGYAGRVVDDSTISEDNPRYRFPGSRERDGKIFEFRKTLFLYNGFRIKTPIDDLIVVMGFTSVWWLYQKQLPNVVCIMGSDCSERQAELIISSVKPSGHVWLMLDGNEVGGRCANSLFLRISPHRFVRWVKLDEGRQPTDLSAAQLEDCLAR